MSAPAKKRRVHPALAALALLVSGVIAARSLTAPGVVSVFVDEPAPVEVEAAPAAVVDAALAPFVDLLAPHGSHDAAVAVRMAFAPVEASAPPPASPLGETKAPAAAWQGADPPRLHVGVVLLSAGSQRAVVDGRVLGVGDRAGDGELVGIQPGRIALRWRGRTLHYELGQDAPREFQDELRRRAGSDTAAPAAKERIQ